MKTYVIFAAIIMSMISAVAFGQAAPAIDEGVAAVRGAIEGAEAGKTAATVGSEAASGAAAVAGATVNGANLINMNSTVVRQDQNLSAANDVSQIGGTCQPGSGFATLVGSDVAEANNAAAHGLMQPTDCMSNTDHKTAVVAVRIANAEAEALDQMGVQNISQATPSQREVAGSAYIKAIGSELKLSTQASAARADLLCEHKDTNGSSQICYGTQTACSGIEAAAAKLGVTPANAAEYAGL